MGSVLRDDARKGAITGVVDDLRRIVQIVYRQAKRAERVADLTGPQFWLVTVLAGSGPVPISRIARKMYLQPSVINDILDRLEPRGLVLRTGFGNLRGETKATLTHKGRKVAEKLPAVPQDLLLKGLEALPGSDLKAVSKGLEVLVGLLGAQEMVPHLLLSPVASRPHSLAGGGRRTRRRFIAPPGPPGSRGA